MSICTCWHDSRNAEVGKGSVLKPQRLLSELHLNSPLSKHTKLEAGLPTSPLEALPQPRYLQHQDEVVHRLVAQEQEVLRRSLVLLVELDLLNHAGVFDES